MTPRGLPRRRRGRSWWPSVDGEAAGCGAFRRHDGPDAAEIKRMYVRPARAGGASGEPVLEDLERRAAAAGYGRVVLETGARQPEAIALYASAGYREIEPYGFYRCSPLSRCFGKDLPAMTRRACPCGHMQV